MDYNKQCLEMMLDLGQNFSVDRMSDLIKAFAVGIVRTMALIDDHEHMHNEIDALCDAMHKDACITHTEFRETGKLPGRKALDAEQFLRDHFNPEVPNG
jgi:hypothetical protein